MSYNKKNLLGHFRQIIEHTTEGVPNLTSGQPMHIIGGGDTLLTMTSRTHPPITMKIPGDGTPTLTIMGPGYRAREEFIAECLRDNEFEELVGRKAIAKQLDSTLKAHHGRCEEDKTVENALSEQILRPLREGIGNWVVYIPVVNLELKCGLQIADVAFVSRERGLLENLRLVLGHKFAASLSQKDQDAQQVALLDVVNESAKCKCWAVATVRCHAENLGLAAKATVERATNLLRAFTPVFYRRDLKAVMGLATEVFQGKAVMLGHNESRDLQFSFDVTGFLAPFELTEERLRHLKSKCGFEVLCALAAKPKKDMSSFEAAILVAAFWMGRAVAAAAPEDAFAWLTIASERLLICDGEETTTEKYADRLAFLLSDVKDERVLIQKAAKRLYDLRSKIVHAGYLGITKEELEQLEQLSLGALISAISLAPTIANHEAFRALLNERKLQ
jgi:hypothetical protein